MGVSLVVAIGREFFDLLLGNSCTLNFSSGSLSFAAVKVFQERSVRCGLAHRSTTHRTTGKSFEVPTFHDPSVISNHSRHSKPHQNARC